MSKERLEELAYNVGISHTGEYARMKADDYVFLYEYALEQAERVQELEVQNKRYMTTLESKSHQIKILEGIITNRAEILNKKDRDIENLKEMYGRLVNDYGKVYEENEYLRNDIGTYRGLMKLNKRYREVVTQAISDLENECLWDALVRLKALEGEG